MTASENDKANQVRQSLLRLFVWPISVLVLLAHIVWRDPNYSVEAAAMCGLLGVATVLAAARMRPGSVPVLPFALANFYVAMGSPAFFPIQLYGYAHRKLRISGAGMDRAAFAVVLFAAIMVATYAVLKPVVAKGIGKRIGASLAPAQYTVLDTVMVRTLAVISFGTAAVFATQSGGNNTQFGPLTLPIYILCGPPVVLSFLAYDAAKRPSTTSSLLLWGGAGLLSMMGLLSGMLGAAAVPILAAAVLAWTLGGKVPWSLVIVTAVALVGLNTAKHTYRSMTWKDGSYVGLAQRSENWGAAVVNTYTGRGSMAYSQSAEAAASRMRTLTQVAQMVDWVPGRIPFAGPDKWLELPLDFVPRVFYPEKIGHAQRWNAEYTVAFGIQNKKATRSTAITLPAVGDGYWRLGWLGVCLEAMFVGGLLAFYAGCAADGSRAGTVLGVSLMMAHTYDQHVFQMLSGIPQHLIMVFGALLAMKLLSNALSTKLQRFSAAPTAARVKRPGEGLAT